jgi:hypothetical protein
LSVIDDILKLNSDKIASEQRALLDLSNLLAKKSQDYGPVAEVLDLVFSLTGYQVAPIPGGEVEACSRLIAKIIRYMTLRSKNVEPNYENLDDTLKDMIGECTRLYGECTANRNTKG